MATIDLESIILAYAYNHTDAQIKAAMREAIRQALELAANNATCEDVGDYGRGGAIEYYTVNKQSITDIIKLVK